jgi:hypothetical protein
VPLSIDKHMELYLQHFIFFITNGSDKLLPVHGKLFQQFNVSLLQLIGFIHKL